MLVRILISTLALWSALTAQTYTAYRIDTFAGGGLPVNEPGTSASLALKGVTLSIHDDAAVDLPVPHFYVSLGQIDFEIPGRHRARRWHSDRHHQYRIVDDCSDPDRAHFACDLHLE
jgi:hypothetical protein